MLDIYLVCALKLLFAVCEARGAIILTLSRTYFRVKSGFLEIPLPFLWNQINVQILHTSPSPSSPDANTLFQLSWSLAWVGSQPPSSVPPPTLQSDLPETKFNDVTPCSKLFSGTLGLLGKSSSTHWPLPNATSCSHLTFPTGLYASAMLATYVSLYLPYYSHLHVFVQLPLSSFSYAYLSSTFPAFSGGMDHLFPGALLDPMTILTAPRTLVALSTPCLPWHTVVSLRTGLHLICFCTCSFKHSVWKIVGAQQIFEEGMFLF